MSTTSIRLKSRSHLHITHPLAKYEDGFLSCILCEIRVVEPAFYKHLHTEEHLLRLDALKVLRDKREIEKQRERMEEERARAEEGMSCLEVIHIVMHNVDVDCCNNPFLLDLSCISCLYFISFLFIITSASTLLPSVHWIILTIRKTKYPNQRTTRTIRKGSWWRRYRIWGSWSGASEYKKEKVTWWWYVLKGLIF